MYHGRTKLIPQNEMPSKKCTKPSDHHFCHCSTSAPSSKPFVETMTCMSICLEYLSFLRLSNSGHPSNCKCKMSTISTYASIGYVVIDLLCLKINQQVSYLRPLQTIHARVLPHEDHPLWAHSNVWKAFAAENISLRSLKESSSTDCYPEKVSAHEFTSRNVRKAAITCGIIKYLIKEGTQAHALLSRMQEIIILYQVVLMFFSVAWTIFKLT